MGTISTLAVDASYETLTVEVSYPYVRCEALPLTAGLAPPLTALLADIASTEGDENKLVLEVLRAEALVRVADDDIDDTVDAVVNTILTITGGDRGSALYLHYVGNQTPSQIKDPVLGAELDTAKLWVPSLKSSPYPNLAALGPALEQQATAADAAQTQLDGARQALKDFRELGPRKALVDKTNALRMSTYGSLGDLVHSNPQLNLPKDFAERFFIHDQRNRYPSSKELKARRDTMQSALANLDSRITAAEAREKAAEDLRAARAAAQHAKKLADAQKKADAAEAALKALQGQPPATTPATP